MAESKTTSKTKNSRRKNDSVKGSTRKCRDPAAVPTARKSRTASVGRRAKPVRPPKPVRPVNSCELVFLSTVKVESPQFVEYEPGTNYAWVRGLRTPVPKQGDRLVVRMKDGTIEQFGFTGKRRTRKCRSTVKCRRVNRDDGSAEWLAQVIYTPKAPPQ